MEENKSMSIGLKVAAILWMIWVFLDYWFKHPLYFKSFGSSFIGIAMVHLMVGVLCFFVIQRLMHGRISVLLMIGVFFAFLWSGSLINLLMYSDVPYTTLNVFLYMGRTVIFIGLVTWVIWSAYLMGSKLLSWTSIGSNSFPAVISTALGLCVFMFVIFIILLAGVFSPWSLATLFALPILLDIKNIKSQLAAFIQPIEKSTSFSALGISCVILLLMMNAINFGHTLSPFPTGFDALNHYINLPKLMSQSGELVKGYQPYNWSLLQAAAVKLTGRIELALIFSWMGLLLVQWATFEMGRKIMKLPAKYALLGVVFFTYMPAVTTQASQELKVDLGLTFMLLAMVMTGFVLLQQLKINKEGQGIYVLAILVGVLGGFALGIKLTAVIALFAMVAILWYFNLGKNAFFGVFFVCLAIVFMARLDAIAGLRTYHSSVQWLQYASLLIGLIFLVIGVRLQIKKAIKTAMLTLMMSLSAGLVFMPWLLKNYSEVDNPTFMEILNGANHGPSFNLKKFEENLQKKSQ
jgi:hypothetical protein